MSLEQRLRTLEGMNESAKVCDGSEVRRAIVQALLKSEVGSELVKEITEQAAFDQASMGLILTDRDGLDGRIDAVMEAVKAELLEDGFDKEMVEATIDGFVILLVKTTEEP